MKLRQGNVFTPVCHSVHGWGGSATPPAGRHPRADNPRPLGRHPPAQCMLEYGQQTGGTHPTGMHSYYNLFY